MRIVRLVAGVAGSAAGMFRCDNLRKPLGLGCVLFVADAAEAGDLRELGDDGAGIVGMLGERAVAAFAGYVGVFAGGAGFGLVVVAQDAGILAGVGDGTLADGGQGAGAVVAVLSEVLGDYRRSDGEENADSGEQDEGGSDQMSRIMEQAAQIGPPWSQKIRQYRDQTAFLS
jgi:hypothetical protein